MCNWESELKSTFFKSLLSHAPPPPTIMVPFPNEHKKGMDASTSKI